MMVMAAFLMLTRGNLIQPATIAPLEGEILVHFIDVGQGDSILVQSENHAVLIDAGPAAASKNLTGYLEFLGIRSLDYVVATHPHSDHIGSMPEILDRFQVWNLWMPDVAHDTAAFEDFLDAVERNNLEITTVQAGDTISAGPIRMTAVAPNSSGHDNLNDYSIVLHMQHGGTAFLFTGDAEALSEAEMLAAGWNLQAGILKAGHHGSRTSSTAAFLDAVGAEAAVISVGAGNQFGHPHQEVLDRLSERDMVVMRTDERGTIVIATDGVNFHLYE
jgi:competence protein ComEC